MTGSRSHPWYARPVLFVSDIQRAVGFYVGKLGFEKKWHEADGEGTVCQVDRGGCEIILCEDPTREDRGRLFLELSREGVDQLRKEVRDGSVPSRESWWGFDVLQIDDPDGNELLVGLENLLSEHRPELRAVVPHVVVSDVARTAAHYRDALGFEVQGYRDGEEVHRDPGRPAAFGIVRRGPISIHLHRGQPSDPPSRAAEGGYDLYFEVTGVEALADELRGRGAEIIQGPAERVHGQRELVVRDCNGFVLAFGEGV